MTTYLRVYIGDRVEWETEFDPHDSCRGDPPCGGCCNCIWAQTEFHKAPNERVVIEDDDQPRTPAAEPE